MNVDLLCKKRYRSRAWHESISIERQSLIVQHVFIHALPVYVVVHQGEFGGNVKTAVVKGEQRLKTHKLEQAPTAARYKMWATTNLSDCSSKNFYQTNKGNKRGKEGTERWELLSQR